MKEKSKNGFTLIEVLIVITIITILILLATTKFMNYAKKAKTENIKNDIKIAENILDEYLMHYDELPNSWASTSISDLNKLANLGELYSTRGLIIQLNDNDSTYLNIDKNFLLDKMNTKLKGNFYTNLGGRVYYEDTGLTSSQNNLFDRDVDITDNQSKIKVLEYSLPNGIYEPGDVIKGYLVIEGIQSGSYNLQADIIHAKTGITLKDSKEFNIEAKEIKTINFSYKVTKNDRIGFYNLDVSIKENLDNLINYKTFDSIYIAQNEWEYFYDDDFINVDKEVIGGIGSLSPDTISYNYVEEASGVDYSSIKFQVNPEDNKTGQATTELPITYGTYESLIRVPDNDALLNGFFLYGDDRHDPNFHYEIDMEILFFEGKWQLWTTIFNESHKNHEENKGEPGVVFHNKVDLDFNPSEDFHSYKIDFYQDYVSFSLDNVEISRWNSKFEYGDMHMYVGTFYTHWLTGELSLIPLEMDVQWIRRKYQ